MGESRSGVHVIAEPDYLYGAGPVSMRIEHIDRANPVHYDGEVWYQVDGVRIGFDGADLGGCSYLVRARRLPPAAGPPRSGPAGNPAPR